MEFIAPDSKIMKKIREADKIHEDDTLIKIVSKFGKIATYVIAIFIIISELHFDISGLVTGLRTYKCCYCSCSPGFSRKFNEWDCNSIR